MILEKGKPSDYGKKIGEIIYQSMIDVINVPEKDIFQIIAEHDSDGLIYSPDYLNIRRTDEWFLYKSRLAKVETSSLKKRFIKLLQRI